MRRETSIARVKANRENAKLSTGPKTGKGKAAVKWNALKHGLLAGEVVIRTGDAEESGSEFEALLASLSDELRPEGMLEEMMVEKIAVCYWRLRRAIRCEVGAIRGAADDLTFRTALKRIDGVKLAERAACLGPAAAAMMRSTYGIDRVMYYLDSFLECVDENGHLTEPALEDLRRIFGIETDTFGYHVFLYNWSAAKDGGKPGDDLPDPAHCRKALVTLLTDEKKRLEVLREALVEQEQMAEAATLLSLSLPVANIADKILRYETSIERQMYRAMSQLERLQRQRRGDYVPPPIKVEVAEQS